MQTQKLVAAVLWSGLFSALAHDLYLMPEEFVTTPGANLRVVFQNGDGFPEGGSPVKPERLRNTRLLLGQNSVDLANITAEATRTTATVRVPASGLGIVTAQTIPNFIELDAEKFRSYLEHENLTNALEWRVKNRETGKPGRERYSKYVKSLILSGKPDGNFRRETGLKIEIIPELDPYSLKPGDTLPVRVLFRGAPAVDVAVESAWLVAGKAQMEVVGRTDKAGRIKVPIKASSAHRLHAIVMERCAEPGVADWESFWASLTFEVKTPR